MVPPSRRLSWGVPPRTAENKMLSGQPARRRRYRFFAGLCAPKGRFFGAAVKDLECFPQVV